MELFSLPTDGWMYVHILLFLLLASELLSGYYSDPCSENRRKGYNSNVTVSLSAWHKPRSNLLSSRAAGVTRVIATGEWRVTYWTANVELATLWTEKIAWGAAEHLDDNILNLVPTWKPLWMRATFRITIPDHLHSFHHTTWKVWSYFYSLPGWRADVYG
jgi:hypothetical protein